MTKRKDRDGKAHAILINADGTHAICMPAGAVFTDKEIGKIIGGFFEIAPCKNPNYVLLVDGDGRPKKLQKNVQASALAQWEDVRGDALYCPLELLDQTYVSKKAN